MIQKGCASIAFEEGAANVSLYNSRSILDKPNLYLRFIHVLESSGSLSFHKKHI